MKLEKVVGYYAEHDYSSNNYYIGLLHGWFGNQSLD